MHNPGRGYRNEFRIIAGEWRRRRLKFPNLPGIRPSPDRVRETLFNWLRNRTPGAHCLDLFAGSGALGLEALSRGAACVLFVDRERSVVESVRANLQLLGARAGEVRQSDAIEFLHGSPQAFDIVFLDPPFASGLLAEALAVLGEPGWLAPGACIYMEYGARGEPLLPGNWELIRQGRAGQVRFTLAKASESLLALK